jgi:hypothetical protein
MKFLLLLLCAGLGFGQGYFYPPAPVASAGTSLTGNFGGTSYCNTCNDSTDNGNPGIAFASYFVTPANLSAVNSLNVWIPSTLTSTTWGLGIYTDNSGFGTISCIATACTIISGNSYSSQWAGDAILIGGVNGTPYVISTGSGTAITLTTSAGTTGTVAYQVVTPGTLVCHQNSTATQTVGLNTLTPSCSLSSSTPYWIVQLSNYGGGSNMEATSSVNSYCPQGSSKLITTTYATMSSWPTTWAATFPTLLGGGSGVAGNPAAFNSNGCYGAYASLSYTSTAAYNMLTAAVGNNNTPGGSAINFPPIQSGDSLLIPLIVIDAVTITSISDCVNSTTTCSSSTDTITNVGCSAVTSNERLCLYYIDRPTTGINNITVQFSTATTAIIFPMEVQGTAASSSADKSCFDSTTGSSTTYSGCSAATSTQAIEFWLAASSNASSFTEYSQGLFSPTGAWNLLYTGGTGAAAFGLFYQITASTGACQATGVYAYSGTIGIQTWCAGFK